MHVSGIFFVVLAYFIDSIFASILLFGLSGVFLVYSEYVRRSEAKWTGIVNKTEARFRSFASWFDRVDVQRPYVGAYWFFFGMGLAFFVFPFDIAVSAALVLAISDSASTLFGMRFGRVKIAEHRTLMGTNAFVLSAILICYFFLPYPNFLYVAVIAGFFEIIPGIGKIRRIDRHGILNDNWIVPLAVGIAAMLL